MLKVWREVENIQPDEPPADMDVSEPVRDPDTGHMISVVAAALSVFMLADGDEDRFAEEGFEKWRSGDLSRYAKDRSETAREDLNTHSPIHCLDHCDPTNEFYRSFGDDY
ncbi:hypothetical protein AS026_31085 [Rhizobium altiplani]|uniref:Uncharacterized protein n=1 Tax=Rhizobium altiplani TaxID=1864509 RepID=A0A109JYN7_9HYPH|nr:hypothetical protein AS026_31175 [Rhizobium altiplani]KWV57286.1 hypothetical protein AS026_31120 [Rhizobium altiplani]KWV57483.1 hypothetical protein AS026_31085 [Rhizobium altiplani]